MLWWRDCFRVSAQLFYLQLRRVPHGIQRFVEKGARNGGTYINPVHTSRFDLNGADGYEYGLLLPANCGCQDGYHVVVQFIPRRCQVAMFVGDGNGGGQFEERQPYYIQEREVGGGRCCRIRYFKFTAGAPVYFVLADRDGRYTVCKCEVADPLATQETNNGIYKTMTIEMTELHSGMVNGESTEELARQLGLLGLLAGSIIQMARRVSRPRRSSPGPKSPVRITGSESSESANPAVA